MERCPSGLRCTPGTRVWMKVHREFESPSLRIYRLWAIEKKYIYYSFH